MDAREFDIVFHYLLSAFFVQAQDLTIKIVLLNLCISKTKNFNVAIFDKDLNNEAQNINE